jgi:hypothetical protein
MVAVASAAVVFNVVLGLCLHGACCTGLPHGHSHGHGHSAHTRLIEEPDSDHVHVHPKASPGQDDQFSVLFLVPTGTLLPLLSSVCHKWVYFRQCSGSGIRCLFNPGIRNRFFPDLGSRIPNPYFLSVLTIFWVKRSIIL